ncbi:hypothetical protein PHAVU_010G076001 [Phaseolus vulgaris]
MVESADLEGEASSGASESVRIDRDVVGDAEGDAVASVYGGSGCVELKGPEVVADLEKLLRTMSFSTAPKLRMTGQHLRSLDESFKQSKDTITMVGCSQQQASSS